MYRGHDNQQTPAVPQRDTVRKLPNRDRPPYVQNTSFPGMDPMKTDFSSIVQDFERLKLARGSRQQQHEQSIDLPHAPAWPISQANTLQAQPPPHFEQNSQNVTIRNLASDKMADFFPSASPTAIGGFVTELLAPGQSIFGIRQGLRAFGVPRPEISFEATAEEFIKILYEANGAAIASQSLVAASQAVATPNSSAFVSTPQVITASAAPQILTGPAASQVVAAPVVPQMTTNTAPWPPTAQTVTAPAAPQMNTAPVTPQTVTAPAAQQMVAAVPQTTASAPGARQSDIVPVVTAVPTSQAGAAPAASAVPSNPVVTQSTTVPDDPDESSIESRSKSRRSEAKGGVIHYIQSSPQNPFKAQTIYQVLKRNHILTYYQSISASKIVKPEIPTDDLMPGDLYIHYNSATEDSQLNMQGQLWVWPKLPTAGWANKSGAYVGQNEILHPVFDNMALFFAPSKSWEPNWYTKSYVKMQRAKEAGNQVMSASASSRSRG